MYIFKNLCEYVHINTFVYIFIIFFSISENIYSKDRYFNENLQITSYNGFNNLIYDKFINKELTKDEFETTSEFNKRINELKSEDNIIIKINPEDVKFDYNADTKTFNYSGFIPAYSNDIEINNKSIKFLSIYLYKNTDSKEYKTTEFGLLIPYNSINLKYFPGKYSHDLKFSFKCDIEKAKTVKNELKKILFEIKPIFYKDNNRLKYTHYSERHGNKYRSKEATIYKSLFCLLKKIYVIKSENNEILAEIIVSKK